MESRYTWLKKGYFVVKITKWIVIRCQMDSRHCIGTPQTKEEPEIKNVEKKRFLCLYLVGDSSLNSFPPEYSSCNVSFK
jgi:hypothetical protein